ncbi:MAG: hypothetical protein ACFB6R_04185 [Alphaproteobacteria bacterium]
MLKSLIQARMAALVAILCLPVALGGCLAAAAGAGYAVGDEINEGDGEFDVLEDVRDDENGSN